QEKQDAADGHRVANRTAIELGTSKGMSVTSEPNGLLAVDPLSDPGRSDAGLCLARAIANKNCEDAGHQDAKQTGRGSHIPPCFETSSPIDGRLAQSGRDRALQQSRN